MNYLILYCHFCIFTEFRKVTLISDSIAKNVTDLFNTKLQIFSGYTIARMANEIQFGKADLEPYDYVIIHVGTNDLGNLSSYDSMISDFGNLIGIIHRKKPSIYIVVSSILPRPCDYDITDKLRRRVNDYLQKSMSKSMRFKFVCSYKPFMYAGKVRRELFAKNDGGLHLNTAGTDALTRFLIKVVGIL